MSRVRFCLLQGQERVRREFATDRLLKNYLETGYTNQGDGCMVAIQTADGGGPEGVCGRDISSCEYECMFIERIGTLTGSRELKRTAQNLPSCSCNF